MKLVKLFKSPWWYLAPVPAFAAIAMAEGPGYWIGGVMTVIWLFSMAVRHLTK